MVVVAVLPQQTDAAMHGARVAVVEGNLLGGTCVISAVFLKKVIGYGAQIGEAIHAYGPDYGFTAENVTFDFTTLKKNRRSLY